MWIEFKIVVEMSNNASYVIVNPFEADVHAFICPWSTDRYQGHENIS